MSEKGKQTAAGRLQPPIPAMTTGGARMAGDEAGRRGWRLERRVEVLTGRMLDSSLNPPGRETQEVVSEEEAPGGERSARQTGRTKGARVNRPDGGCEGLLRIS